MRSNTALMVAVLSAKRWTRGVDGGLVGGDLGTGEGDGAGDVILERGDGVQQRVAGRRW